MSLPAAAHSGVSQAATACPSTSTLQAPHWFVPHPKWLPVRPSRPRNTESSGVAGSASMRRSMPLTRSVTGSLTAGSLHLDAGGLDDLGPLVDIAAQIRIELDRRHDERLGALLEPCLLHLGLAQHLVDLGIELVDDRLGRARR